MPPPILPGARASPSRRPGALGTSLLGAAPPRAPGRAARRGPGRPVEVPVRDGEPRALPVRGPDAHRAAARGLGRGVEARVQEAGLEPLRDLRRPAGVERAVAEPGLVAAREVDDARPLDAGVAQRQRARRRGAVPARVEALEVARDREDQRRVRPLRVEPVRQVQRHPLERRRREVPRVPLGQIDDDDARVEVVDEGLGAAALRRVDADAPRAQRRARGGVRRHGRREAELPAIAARNGRDGRRAAGERGVDELRDVAVDDRVRVEVQDLAVHVFEDVAEEEARVVERRQEPLVAGPRPPRQRQGRLERVDLDGERRERAGDDVPHECRVRRHRDDVDADAADRGRRVRERGERDDEAGQHL
mmetsp:Transcript_30662/g.99559  ORF Transcript_30662/g.99559 Transcript_30662/m.99559 type:complete len:363 (-) Transcript_30662:299-1387(-)